MAAPLLRRLCNLVVPATSYPSVYVKFMDIVISLDFLIVPVESA